MVRLPVSAPGQRKRGGRRYLEMLEYTLIILALWKLRQEDCQEFEESLDYITRPCLRKTPSKQLKCQLERDAAIKATFLYPFNS